MGKLRLSPGGGGGDLDVITAGAADVVAPKVIVNKDGEPVAGTMPDRGTWNGSVGMNGSVAIPAGKHNGSGKVNGPAVTQRGAWTGRIGVNGKAMIPEGYHNGAGYVDQSIATQGGLTYTPNKSTQTAAVSGKYMTGNVVINPIPANYADITSGATVFSNGVFSFISGLHPTYCAKIYPGTDGSIWVSCTRPNEDFDFIFSSDKSVDFTPFSSINFEFHEYWGEVVYDASCDFSVLSKSKEVLYKQNFTIKLGIINYTFDVSNIKQHAFFQIKVKPRDVNGGQNKHEIKILNIKLNR